MTVSLQNVGFSYGSLEVLRKISMNVQPNQIACILGPSGCGKTTLLQILAGLLKPTGGNIHNENKTTGYVFQEDRLLPWKTVYENIAIVNPKPVQDEILQWIHKVDLQGYEHKYPRELSGGMKKRCALARAFYYNGGLLLMDEPFNSLDYFLRADMLQIVLKLWQKSKTTIVFVTHEIDEALLLGDVVHIFSKRPAEILQSIPLLIPQEERTLQDPQIQDARQEILKVLWNKPKPGCSDQ